MPNVLQTSVATYAVPHDHIERDGVSTKAHNMPCYGYATYPIDIIGICKESTQVVPDGIIRIILIK